MALHLIFASRGRFFAAKAAELAKGCPILMFDGSVEVRRSQKWGGTATSTGLETLVASLFRHESGRFVAALTRLFGPHNLPLAEDVVQEALESALQAWKFQMPDNPTAWLTKVARNRALDVIRHSANGNHLHLSRAPAKAYFSPIFDACNL